MTQTKDPNNKRGLGEVLHFFIPEDEQAEARARAEKTESVTRTSSPWALIAHPNRPLHAALAYELAHALSDGPSRIIGSFAPSELVPRSEGVLWEVAEDPAAIPALINGVLPARLLVIGPKQAASLEAQPSDLQGWLLALDASVHGVAWGLQLLRDLPRRPLRALFIGAGDEARRHHVRLAEEARRQFNIEVELLGLLPSRSDRALLSGRSADLHYGPLREACERLSLPTEPITLD